jgi:hypothetical protein
MPGHIDFLEFVVGYCKYNCAVTIIFRVLRKYRYVVFMFHLIGIGPGVVDVNINAKGLEFMADIDGAGIADVGAVFIN